MRIALRQDVKIDLLLSNENELIGLGNVGVGEVALRSAERPILFRSDTPDGIHYTRFIVTDVVQNQDGARVEMTAVGQPWGRTEYLDEYSQSMINLGLTAEVEDRMTLTLTPVSLALGGRDWIGFSYAVEFQSDSRKIHRLWTHGTWEIGGRITGNTVLHQGQCNRPAYCGAKETAFTTACLKTLDQLGSPQGVSYQLAPRGGLIQGFDFQFAAQGALLMFWPQWGSISSRCCFAADLWRTTKPAISGGWRVNTFTGGLAPPSVCNRPSSCQRYPSVSQPACTRGVCV